MFDEKNIWIYKYARDIGSLFMIYVFGLYFFIGVEFISLCRYRELLLIYFVEIVDIE